MDDSSRLFFYIGGVGGLVALVIALLSCMVCTLILCKMRTARTSQANSSASGEVEMQQPAQSQTLPGQPAHAMQAQALGLYMT